MFGNIVYDTLLFLIPALLILSFAITLYRYRTALKQNEQNPETFSPEEIKTRKTWFIVCAVAAGVVVFSLLGFGALVFLAVQFM